MNIFYLINGINTCPGDARNWNGRGVTWIHTRADGARAEKIEYYCNAFERAIWQRRRAEKLARTMSFYSGEEWVHHVVGHSNGADVALTAIRDFDLPPVSVLHLVCGATEASFDKNGLNKMLRNGDVERVRVYVAGEDLALRLASSWIARALGYGCLGLHGPRGVDLDVRDRVEVVRAGRWAEFGHSDCWGDMDFDDTMEGFTKGV